MSNKSYIGNATTNIQVIDVGPHGVCPLFLAFERPFFLFVDGLAKRTSTASFREVTVSLERRYQTVLDPSSSTKNTPVACSI